VERINGRRTKFGVVFIFSRENVFLAFFCHFPLYEEKAAARSIDDFVHNSQLIHHLVKSDAEALSAQLQSMRERFFPPSSIKELRRFSSSEAARLVGVSDSLLRKLSLAGEGPAPQLSPGGRRLYTLGQIHELRAYLANTGGRSAVPHRSGSEHLQVIAITNFKGGSGKTTTSAHLAQHLALTGLRVLAVDLDPQASLSALFGYQPELDVGANETLYGAIRYDDERRDLKEIVRHTYFDGLDIIPGHLELHEFEHTTPRALVDGTLKPDEMFFMRVGTALAGVGEGYDVVVIDCPPQLGFLTLSALCAATSVIVTIHPQMLDIASMSQFLLMTSDLLGVVASAGGDLQYDFFRYLVTRYEPNDGPQTQIVGFLRSLFGERVLTHPMLKSTAISDAGLTKQTLYEVGRENFARGTYDRAIEALDAVNGEIRDLIYKAWGRRA
jgi:chromosome partitioning protein